MAGITFHGNPVNTSGALPVVGSVAPGFSLTKGDLSETTLADYAGKCVVLNIFPSIDTPVCAASVRRFNEAAAGKPDVAGLCGSGDLPFALGRFCGAEGLANVETLSAFRSPAFGKAYGVDIIDSPLQTLLARAVVVIDKGGKVVYTELVPEVAQEPDYEAALKALAC